MTLEQLLDKTRRNPSVVLSLRNVPIEAQVLAVTLEPSLIGNMENPPEVVQLTAVKAQGFTLGDIKNPSKFVQLEALKSCGHAIKFIKHPSNEMKEIAWNSIVEFDKGKHMWQIPDVLMPLAIRDGYKHLKIGNADEGFVQINKNQPSHKKSVLQRMRDLFL